MTRWKSDDLSRFGSAEEVQIAGPVKSITSEAARSTTLKIVPSQQN